MKKFALPIVYETSRESQCPARRYASCGDVDILLGYKEGMSLDNCKKCLVLGGLKTKEARDWRVQYVKDLLDKAVKSNFKNMPMNQVLTILGRHIDPAESERVFLGLCLRLGEEVAVKLAENYYGKLCVEKVKEMYSNLTPHQKWDLLPDKQKWELTRSTWEKAESLFKNLVSYNLFGERVSVEELELRNISCSGLNLKNEKVQEPCVHYSLSVDKKHHYCNSCGCGDKKLAYLDLTLEGEKRVSKLEYKPLECPLRRPGFANSAV